LECASTAIWLVRADASDERITRALKWNVADVRDGDRAFTDAGLPVPTPLQARLDKIEVVATRCGLAFKPISGGYRSSDAVKEAQNLLDRSPFGVLMPWPLASGNAHGRRWSTMAFADTMQKQPTSDPDVSGLRIENDWNRVAFFGLAAATTVKAAVALYEKRAATA
jgi:hypothetical protein